MLVDLTSQCVESDGRRLIVRQKFHPFKGAPLLSRQGMLLLHWQGNQDTLPSRF